MFLHLTLFYGDYGFKKNVRSYDTAIDVNHGIKFLLL